jgi:uncharacterized membrane protein
MKETNSSLKIKKMKKNSSASALLPILMLIAGILAGLATYYTVGTFKVWYFDILPIGVLLCGFIGLRKRIKGTLPSISAFIYVSISVSLVFWTYIVLIYYFPLQNMFERSLERLLLQMLATLIIGLVIGFIFSFLLYKGKKNG